KAKPRVGWVRADLVAADERLKDESLRLRREIDYLNEELSAARSRMAPEGVEELARGSETTSLAIDFEPREYGLIVLEVRWDTVIRAVLPQTFGGGAPPEAIINAIGSLVEREATDRGVLPPENLVPRRNIIAYSDYGKVTNQMVALGLIEAQSN